jgi:hypothetical protein
VGSGIRRYSAVSFTVRRLWTGVSLTDGQKQKSQTQP